MNIANKPENTEAPASQTVEKEVAKKGISDVDILNDIVNPDQPLPAPESGKKDEPKAEKKDEEAKPATPPETKPEAKPEEPFASLNGTNFKTKDELIAFVKKQVGYNSFLTGAVKKVHPEWFNADGSIKTKDLDKVNKEATKEIKKATETVTENADVAPDDMTPEQKAEVDKAKALLRKLGFISADDEKFKNLEQQLKDLRQEKESEKIAEAKTVVEAFEKAHPISVEHRENFAQLIRDRGYNDIEKAWNVFKIENSIEETIINPAPKQSPETIVPTTLPKGTGNAPEKAGNPDFMDDIINTKGI